MRAEEPVAWPRPQPTCHSASCRTGRSPESGEALRAPACCRCSVLPLGHLLVASSLQPRAPVQALDCVAQLRHRCRAGRMEMEGEGNESSDRSYLVLVWQGLLARFPQGSGLCCALSLDSSGDPEELAVCVTGVSLSPVLHDPGVRLGLYAWSSHQCWFLQKNRRVFASLPAQPIAAPTL